MNRYKYPEPTPITVDPSKPKNQLSAYEALELSRADSTKTRIERVFDLIRVVSENGKRRALIAVTEQDNYKEILDCLRELGYQVNPDVDKKECMLVSWQYADKT